MLRFIRMAYHWVMAEYHGWQKRRLVRQIRKLGKKHGLPSLDAWTDDQVALGFWMLKQGERDGQEQGRQRK